MAHGSITDDPFVAPDRPGGGRLRRGPRPGSGPRPGGAAGGRAQGAATPAAGPQPQPPTPAKIKWLLKAWEGQSAKLKTLDVRIYRIDKDPRWKDEVHYEGRAVFKSPNLAYLDFRTIKLVRNAKGQMAPVKDPKNPNAWVKASTETIVCGQNDVWQYFYPGRRSTSSRWPRGTAAGPR